MVFAALCSEWLGRARLVRRQGVPGNASTKAWRGGPASAEKGYQCRRHLAGCLKSRLGLLGHHLGRKCSQLKRDLPANQVQGLGVHGMMRLEDFRDAFSSKRWTAAEQVVKSASQTIDIGANVCPPGIGNLLRGHEGGRARQAPGKPILTVSRLMSTHAAVEIDHAGFESGLGQPEVKELDDRPHLVARRRPGAPA